MFRWSESLAMVFSTCLRIVRILRSKASWSGMSGAAATVEVDEDLQAAADDVVRFSALDIDDKADAARIMLVARIVESSAGPFCRHPRSLFYQCRGRAGPLLLRGKQRPRYAIQDSMHD